MDGRGRERHAEKEIWSLLIFSTVSFGGIGNHVKAGALSGGLEQ